MTNKPGFLTDPLVAAIPALKNASVVISGDTLAEAKPSPLPLLHCAKLMQVKPNRCLYIGDAQRDIQAGKAAGMHTATALWGYIPSIDEANSWNADFNWQSPIDGFNHYPKVIHKQVQLSPLLLMLLHINVPITL